jgi:uncharacterized protein YifN (PemK superfamily)
MWAKCDMVLTVGLARLDRVKVRIGGVRAYQTHKATPEDLAAVVAGVKAALGIP